MVTFLKKYGLIILLVIAVGIFVLLYTRRKNISFDFNVDANIADLLSNLTSRMSSPNERLALALDVPLTTTINNKSAVKVILQNIAGFLSYNGESILQTRSGSTALSRVEIPANGSIPVTDTVQVFINSSSIKFFTELLAGNKPALKYNINAVVFGKPKSFTNITSISERSVGKISYDTGRCCYSNNPCGWSKSTYDKQCNA